MPDGVLFRVRVLIMPAHRSDRRSARTNAETFYYNDRQSALRRTGSWSSESRELDAGLYERQMAGISALIALANDVATISRTGELRKLSAEGAPEQGRLRALWTRLREDPMTLNSLYLVLNTGLLAGFGFAFWIITAHLFSVPDVGQASALVSAAGLIGNCALLGLNNGIGRYLPESRNPAGLISSGMALVGTCGAIGAIIYLLILPLIAPNLGFVEKSPVLAFGFVLITATEAVNTLTDSIFVATRNAKYTAFVDGIIGGAGKVVLAFFFAGAGTYGLFLASASGFVLASIASLFLIYTVMHTRLDLRRPLKTLKPLFGFAGANYVGNVFNMIPGLAVPIILLDRLGSSSAAYFFIVFQVVQIVYAAALALEQTFLAEGSRADADMRALRRRSVRMLVMFCVPTALGIIAVGRFLLLAFGGPYAKNGFASLVILCLAAGPIAANYWYLTVLRLAGKLRAIVVVNATYAAATCIAVWVGASHGLTGVATGWLIGALVATCVAVVAAREGQARHREPVAPGDANGGYAPQESGYALEEAGYASQKNAERPRRLQRPVNPFEQAHDRAEPGVRNGGYGPRGSSGPQGMQRPAHRGEPGYDRVDPGVVNGGYPGAANDGYPGAVNGGYGVGENAGYAPIDPGQVNGRYASGSGNNDERPRRMQRPADPNEPGDDHGNFDGQVSLWD